MSSALSSQASRALCVTRNPSLRRAVRRTLSAVGTAVDFADELNDANADGAALIIVDHESRRGGDEKLVEIAGPQGKIIVIGDSLEDDEVIALLRHRSMDHLISDLDDGDERELVVTSVKLMGGDIFGLDKYLAWGVRILEQPIRSYEDKRRALTDVSAYAKEVGARRQLVSRIESVTDELLMNALYDAPAIRHGDSREARVAKSSETVLSAEETALLRFGSDGRYLAVSVQDNYGELHKEAILDNLSRARADRGRPITGAGTGGAGLGLYFILSAATRFIANIEPGKRTEVICLFDLCQSGRDATTCAQSLHIFHT
ncbi:hypothetical protein [Haliangium sp.]|uniref:hypothetical protein n=1 Tax=Haliangium sp. TaxID=2663208 RepID=UPI003D09828F